MSNRVDTAAHNTLIYGVGYNSRGKYKSKIDRKNTKEYDAWHDMMKRCYNPKYQEKFPTYRGCSVSREWHDYQVFAEWYINSVGYVNNYQLDKDLLVRGNKIYSADFCCLVPQELNSLLTDRKAARGLYPVGVTATESMNKFRARLRVDNNEVYLGRYRTIEEAFAAYKSAKELNVKSMAVRWRGKIDSRAYQALLEWRVL